MKNLFKIFWSALFLITVNLSFGQVSDSKTLKAQFTGKNVVSLVHMHGPMSVQKSTDNKIYITATISASAKDRESLELLFDHFSINKNDRGERLELRTNLDIEQWNNNNNNTTITFKDGKKVKGIKDLNTSVTLLMPDLMSLELENKYGDIQLETNGAEKVFVKLFSGEMNTSQDLQNLELNFKYSKAFLKNAGETKMVLFDSDIEMGNVGKTEVSSKYSEVELGDVTGDLELVTFDDKWEVGNVSGNMEISDKYSEFEFGTFREIRAMMFDANFGAVSGVKLHLTNSKYSKFKIGELNRMEFDLSFDDKVELKKVGSLLCGDIKYTDIEIDELTENLHLGQSFDNNVKVEKVDANFSNILLDGKYTKMDLRFDDGARFAVGVNMQYGKFDHPQFDIRSQKMENNRIEISGFVGQEKVDGSRLSVIGFDNTVYWR